MKIKIGIVGSVPILGGIGRLDAEHAAERAKQGTIRANGFTETIYLLMLAGF